MARLVRAAVLAAVLLLTARLSVPGEGAASNAGKALQAALASRLEACPGSRLEHHELARYYPVAAPMPVWVDDNGPLPPARRLRAALEQAEDEGLSPDRYELRGIEARWQATVPAEQACLELLLTSAFARWGRDLAMGRLSFIFPNAFDTFLHDTPDRSLFEREVRASSEGCVRIEHAMALALHILRREPEWTEDRIQGEIDALRHRVLALPESIPVYVVYLPSWVDEEGLVHFRPDHYGRERVLARHFRPETLSARTAHGRVLGANGVGVDPTLVLDGFNRRVAEAGAADGPEVLERPRRSCRSEVGMPHVRSPAR